MKLTIAIVCVIMIYGFIYWMLRKWNDEIPK